MERKNGVLEAQKIYGAGDDRLQPKTYRLGVNFQLIIEIDEQSNIIDITDYRVRN
ncbi:MAG: hypothetical protein KAW47_10920 [Thermoplasmatales archaeon]|nr:hypothetical protein [Thermoplasmatales archaeon]